ncbi:hypothetical protein BN1263130031 [Stenotrophomonas maltophilia]|nr:hypothetical protein BN1263130031 [Stenotrophomonas maltophilia]
MSWLTVRSWPRKWPSNRTAPTRHSESPASAGLLRFQGSDPFPQERALTPGRQHRRPEPFAFALGSDPHRSDRRHLWRFEWHALSVTLGA